MTRMPARRRTPALAGPLLALALLLLAGCGGLHPGVSAEVGDQEISDAEVDSLSRDLCTAFLGVGQEVPPQGVPRSVTVKAAVAGFVLRAVGDQMGEQYGVAPGSAYETAVTQTRQLLAGLEPEVTDNILETWVAGPYLRETLISVGEQRLVADGVAESTLDEQLDKGIELAQVWVSENEVELDPRFPEFSFDDETFGNFKDASAASGFAVSDVAKQSDSAEAPAEWVGSLPPSQICR